MSLLATVLLFFLWEASAWIPYKDKVFYQDEATIFTPYGTQIADWQQLPFSEDITQVATFIGDEAEFYLLTASELYAFDARNGTSIFTPILCKNLQFSSSVRIRGVPQYNGQSGFAFASSSSLSYCLLSDNLSTCGCTSVSASFGIVNDIAVTSKGGLWIGAENGLFFIADRWNPFVNQIGVVTQVVNAVAVDENDQVAAGTNTFLWRFIGNNWHYFRTPGIIDAAITSLTFDMEGTLWVANDVCINQQYSNLTFHRVSGIQGLPFPNVTADVAGADGAVWIGTINGASRYYKGNWDFYFGARWLPGEDFTSGQTVSSIATSDKLPSSALIATDGGMSLIRFNPWTLEKKAQFYQDLVYPRHDRFGLVADVSLQKFGDLSSYVQQSSDNDGLWTSIYVVAQTLRYAATGDPEAKAAAWHSFEAMEFLNNVTGIEGLMARSVLHQTNKPVSGTWHNSTVYPGWIWKGDTSSDEVVGHMWAYPIVYQLLAETPEEKARAYRLIYNIMTYIVTNDYYLIDVTGNHTTWGVWNPTYLNDNSLWYDERGLNSLQILTWILAAYEITGDQLFLNAYNDLVNNYAYNINIINQKITQPSDDNFSDDELAFLPYFLYAVTSPSLLQTEMELSIKRAWEIARPEKPALYNFIYGAYGAQDFDIDGAIYFLQTFPLSYIDWPTMNSIRQDIFPNPDANRAGQRDSLNVLPFDETDVLRWNTDPYTLDAGSGYSETDPSSWLVAYWMGRYLGFIV